MKNINLIWDKIVSNQGKTFYTLRKLQFTYKVEGNYLKTSRTDYTLSKTDFEIALNYYPYESPSILKDKIQGPSYVWGILHDERIIKINY
jgi:hypothetical protein